MENSQQLLVWPQDEGGALPHGYQVVHELSPRVWVVVTTAPEVRAEQAAEVGALYWGAAPPSELLARLSPGERMAVEGWLARSRAKARAADGRSWDTPGLVPPDHPPHV